MFIVSVLPTSFGLHQRRRTTSRIYRQLTRLQRLQSCMSSIVSSAQTPRAISRRRRRVSYCVRSHLHGNKDLARIEYISIDYLVTDHRLFCQLAYERNCLVQVAQLVNSITPLESHTDLDEDEPESVSRLREVGGVAMFCYLVLTRDVQAALTVVAAIAMFDNDIRTAVTDELKIIPAVQASLSHRYVGVRYAACQCARALSRAVAALRTNIVDTGLGMSVFQLFMKADEDRQVMHAASTVVCNIVTDFSPLRLVWSHLVYSSAPTSLMAVFPDVD